MRIQSSGAFSYNAGPKMDTVEQSAEMALHEIATLLMLHRVDVVDGVKLLLKQNRYLYNKILELESHDEVIGHANSLALQKVEIAQPGLGCFPIPSNSATILMQTPSVDHAVLLSENVAGVAKSIDNTIKNEPIEAALSTPTEEKPLATSITPCKGLCTDTFLTNDVAYYAHSYSEIEEIFGRDYDNFSTDSSFQSAVKADNSASNDVSCDDIAATLSAEHPIYLDSRADTNVDGDWSGDEDSSSYDECSVDDSASSDAATDSDVHGTVGESFDSREDISTSENGNSAYSSETSSRDDITSNNNGILRIGDSTTHQIVNNELYRQNAIHAVTTSDLDYLEHLLNLGTNVNTSDKYGNTLLILAAQCNNLCVGCYCIAKQI